MFEPIAIVKLHKFMVTIIDITLKRILSLIPKKEDGKFKHGALSTFARKLGFKDGHIISDWIAGNSTSYLNYLYQISAFYNVSVKWLKGETDIKNLDSEPETEVLEEYIRLFLVASFITKHLALFAE